MKLDFLNTLQIFFAVLFFMSIFWYVVNTVKSFILKLDYKIIRKLYTHALDYRRNLVIRDYISFEKYDIWRYCVHF